MHARERKGKIEKEDIWRENNNERILNVISYKITAYFNKLKDITIRKDNAKIVDVVFQIVIEILGIFQYLSSAEIFTAIFVHVVRIIYYLF